MIFFSSQLILKKSLTLVKMTPLDLFAFSASKVFENSLKVSKFKLFTGGRFKVTVAIPVLSLTSTRMSSFDCVDWNRTALSEKFLVVIGARRLREFMMRTNLCLNFDRRSAWKYNKTLNVDESKGIKKKEKIRYEIFYIKIEIFECRGFIKIIFLWLHEIS